MDKIDILISKINAAQSAKTNIDAAISELKKYFKTEFTKRLDDKDPNVTIGKEDKIRFTGKVDLKKIGEALKALRKLDAVTQQNSQVHGMFAEFNYINKAANSEKK